MIGVIQMQKPSKKSCDYYINFYNMYNLLQINDVIIYQVFEEVVDEYQLNIVDLLEKLNPNNYAKELPTLFRCMGIEPPENILEMCNDDRGIDTSLAYELQSKNVNPFDWFRKINEFLQLYAIFGQAIKEFLVKNIRESEIINELIIHLDNELPVFLDRFGFKTFGIIEEECEIKAIWDYYTKMRNCIAHSGGRVTDKASSGFNDINSKHKSVFENIYDKEFLTHFFLLRECDDYVLFNYSYSKGDVLRFDNNLLNFFRMFCVFIIESLNETNKNHGTI